MVIVAVDRFGERLLSEDATTLIFEMAVAKPKAFAHEKVGPATSTHVHFKTSIQPLPAISDQHQRSGEAWMSEQI